MLETASLASLSLGMLRTIFKWQWETRARFGSYCKRSLRHAYTPSPETSLCSVRLALSDVLVKRNKCEIFENLACACRHPNPRLQPSCQSPLLLSFPYAFQPSPLPPPPRCRLIADEVGHLDPPRPDTSCVFETDSNSINLSPAFASLTRTGPINSSCTRTCCTKSLKSSIDTSARQQQQKRLGTDRSRAPRPCNAFFLVTRKSLSKQIQCQETLSTASRRSESISNVLSRPNQPASGVPPRIGRQHAPQLLCNQLFPHVVVFHLHLPSARWSLHANLIGPRCKPFVKKDSASAEMVGASSHARLHMEVAQLPHPRKALRTSVSNGKLWILHLYERCHTLSSTRCGLHLSIFLHDQD